MKKIVMILAAAFLLMGTGTKADAQISNLLNKLKGSSSSSSSSSSSDILNTISDVVSAVTGSSNISLPGTWTYQGVALSLESESTLSSLAGSVVSSSLENQVDEYLEKVGLTAGAATITFEEDETFSATLGKTTSSGTYSLNEDGDRITMKFGQKLNYLSISGDLSGSSSSLEILFEADKFFDTMQSILSIVGSQNSIASTLSSLSENYDGMQIGVQLTK